MRWLYRIFRLYRCPHKYKTYDTEPIYYDDKQRAKGMYSQIMNYQECTRCGNRKSTRA